MFGHDHVRAARWLAGAGLAAISAAAAQAQPAAQADYALPAQELAHSLREVALASGVSVLISGELAAGRQAPALRGRFTAREAVERLIEGSGLTVAIVGEALVVRRAGDVPASSQSGADALQPDAQGTIIVTGTHLRGAQPTSPLITISREEIDRTGATSVDQLMRTVPQNMQGGVNKENVGVVLPDQDVTDHGAGLNLRGLGQRATLVLVNGRRLAPSSFGSFVDVSLIPVSALERVEILTDGASAIYGSDAVGGVVNLILRDRFDGLETALQVGSATRGGGEQLLLSQTAGHDWGRGNAMLSYEYRLENEVRAGDRRFTIDLRPDTFLLPRERRHSLLGTLDQEIAPGLSGGLTTTFARRTTERTVFQAISPLPVGVEAEAEAFSIAGELRYVLPGGWRVRLDATYGLSATSQRQTQPGGIELVNARDVRNTIREAGLRVDGALFALPAGPVRVALGGQLRGETYRDAFSSSTFDESVRAAERDVVSVFGEMLVPIFSAANRVAGAERLQLSIAGRHDRYSRTGSTFDPKAGILWTPVTGLDLRASYSTSFRAPLLSEVSGAYTALLLPASFFFVDPAEAPPGALAAFLQGSDPDVRPETSRNWTLGGDWSPRFAPGLTLSFNYYAIRFSDRIALPTTRINVIGDPAFEPIIDRMPDLEAVARLFAAAQAVFDFTGPGFSDGGAGPGDISFVIDDRVSNTAFTRTRGFDLGLRYAFNLGANAFVLDANVNRIIAFEEQLTPASPVIQALDRPFRPLDWRGRGGISWSRGGWAGSLFVNHAGGYLDDRRPVAERVRAHSTLDAGLAYTFGTASPGWLRGTRLALFAENLLDRDPPRLQPEPGSTRGVGYDPVNASGRGRFVTFQLRRAW
jgi:iron complex outermembrane recepter protein